MRRWGPPGIGAALLAAALFGASTPFAKLLLPQTGPWLLAGLLYTGSGVGLWLVRRGRRAPPVALARAEWPWMVGAITAGGVIAPVLLLAGLAGTSASSAALLLNAEGVFTVLLAWFVFKENFDRRVALGMVLIVAGAIVLAWPDAARPGLHAAGSTLLIVAACFAWALDNNLTRKVSLADATWIAMAKGLSAGATNLAIAGFLGGSVPSLPAAGGALVLGFLSYGASLTLFVIALRHLGTARTGAYFSVAPYVGAVLSIVLLREAVTVPLIVAGAAMALGVFLHLSERHRHAHTHEWLEHDHLHEHGDDLHHDHSHEAPVAPGTRHAHRHVHPPTTHEHEHFPDAHHRHTH